jgi:hypothetical protein
MSISTTTISLGVMWLGRDADNSPSPSAKFKSVSIHTQTYRPFTVCAETNLPRDM